MSDFSEDVSDDDFEVENIPKKKQARPACEAFPFLRSVASKEGMGLCLIKNLAESLS
jgi:hypothetical protein